MRSLTSCTLAIFFGHCIFAAAKIGVFTYQPPANRMNLRRCLFEVCLVERNKRFFTKHDIQCGYGLEANLLNHLGKHNLCLFVGDRRAIRDAIVKFVFGAIVLALRLQPILSERTFVGNAISFLSTTISKASDTSLCFIHSQSYFQDVLYHIFNSHRAQY